MIGFDCDRPRGSFISSNKGQEMASQKILSLEKINKILEKEEISRTYFICGNFIESMINNFGSKRIKNAFNSKSKLVEIGDHSYSHKIVKKIKTRPDKLPANFKEIKEEFQINTDLFQKHFSEQNIFAWGGGFGGDIFKQKIKRPRGTPRPQNQLSVRD